MMLVHTAIELRSAKATAFAVILITTTAHIPCGAAGKYKEMRSKFFTKILSRLQSCSSQQRAPSH